MAEVLFNQNPSITDTVVFPLQTPDSNGCFGSMPYRVNNLTIYFIERDFSSGNQNLYRERTPERSSARAADAAEAILCGDITPQAISDARLGRGNKIQPSVWRSGQATAISNTNPAVITSVDHGLSTGDRIYISQTNSSPSIDGEYVVTVLTSNTFSVPYDLSSGSSGTYGSWNTVAISATNPTVVTSVNHGLTSGEKVFLLKTNSSPSIDGEYEVSVISVNQFTISRLDSTPVDLSGGVSGTDGIWYTYDYVKNHAAVLRSQANSNASIEEVYFDKASPVQIVGTADFPAWLTGNSITGISKANPTVITSASHGLSNGDDVYIYCSNSSPGIDGLHKVTVLSGNTFSIPVNLSAGIAGTKAIWYTPEENSNNFLDLVVKDGKTTIGLFEYYWEPSNVREGDFFICWTWTPTAGGDSISSHYKFKLMGNTAVTTVVPSHFTKPEKYITLLTRYTPEMFKEYIAPRDVTPNVIDRFNQSVALGFTTLEDLANQLVDLQNPNVLSEPLLPYLANYFNLKLKSNDPARWRGQIVRAVDSFKRKGTRGNMEAAMSLAGMKLTGLNQLWQVVSKYTFQEVFEYTGSNSFELSREMILPVDVNNFDLYIRYANEITAISDTNPCRITSASHGLSTGDVIYINGSNSVPSVDGRHVVKVIDANNFSIPVYMIGRTAGDSGNWFLSEWTQLTSASVGFATSSGVTTMTWVNPTPLTDGDRIRVLYQFENVPDMTEQMLEDYIRLLPLLDTRDDLAQVFPLKNWNVRGIQDNDSLFSLIVPNRNPFHDLIIFGKIRTEFPYSENIYNMDEYNGSIRDSRNPCDIGREFIDPCFACISSSYNLDVEIYDISDDRISELYEVVEENAPAHAVLHTANIYGGFTEFIPSPLEDITAYMTYFVKQFALAGDAQMYFNRAMKLSNLNNLGDTECLLRDHLASSGPPVLSGQAAIAYNSEIVLYCPAQPLEGIGVRSDSSTVLEILTGSYAGSYQILNASGHAVVFDTAPTEPISECNSVFEGDGLLASCAMGFRIFQPVIDNFFPEYIDPPGSLCDIEQDNYILMSDDSKDFGAIGIQTQFDSDHPSQEFLAVFEVEIPAYGVTKFNILDVDPYGNLIIEHDSLLPMPPTVDTYTVTGVSYSIYNGATLVTSGSGGTLSITPRAKVSVINYEMWPISKIISTENHFHRVSGTDYPVIEFVNGTTDKFYIGSYIGGDVAGANLVVNRRLVDNQLGYLSHRGLNLKVTGSDLEQSLSIQNGENASTLFPTPLEVNPDQTTYAFMENFIIQVNGGEYYWITSIDGDDSGDTTMVISGNDMYWKTLANGGTNVTIDVYKYVQQGATIMGQQGDLETHEFRTLDRSGRPVITGTDSDGTVLESLGLPEGQFHDLIRHSESVSYNIEYRNGFKEEGEIR